MEEENKTIVLEAEFGGEYFGNLCSAVCNENVHLETCQPSFLDKHFEENLEDRYFGSDLNTIEMFTILTVAYWDISNDSS